MVSALLLISVASFSGTAAAQSGLYVEGKSPSGEAVKVLIKSRPAFKYPRRAQRLGVEGFVVLAFDVNEQGELIDLRQLNLSHALYLIKQRLSTLRSLNLSRQVLMEVQFMLLTLL